MPTQARPFQLHPGRYPHDVLSGESEHTSSKTPAAAPVHSAAAMVMNLALVVKVRSKSAGLLVIFIESN